MRGVSPQEMRRLFETSFEPRGDDYVYFKDRWSSGIPVTADEREQFLAEPTLASAYAFRRKIAGRPPVTPPRRGASFRVMDATPTWMVAACLIAAVGCLHEGLVASNLPVRVSNLAAGSAFAALGVVMVARRIIVRDRPDISP